MIRRREEPAIFLRSVTFVACMSFLAALCSCTKSEEPTIVDFPKREEMGFKETSNSITHACVPQSFHRVPFEGDHPLIEYLKREMGLPIRQVFPDGFDGCTGCAAGERSTSLSPIPSSMHRTVFALHFPAYRATGKMSATSEQTRTLGTEGRYGDHSCAR
jgi:hypothetical protein